MTPAEAVAALDRSLAAAGEEVTLRRGGAAVVCRAHVRGYRPDELSDGITQQDREVILSPTPIIAAGWPGGTPPPTAEDLRVPRKGDQIVIAGRPCAVEAAAGIRMAGELVRIELRVRG